MGDDPERGSRKMGWYHRDALDFRSEFEAIDSSPAVANTSRTASHIAVFYSVHSVNAVEIFTSMVGLRAKTRGLFIQNSSRFIQN